MPTTLHHPAKTESHCAPCQFHKLIGALHVRQGPGGYREYACTNPDVDDAFAQSGWQINNDGKYIGKTEKQPDWCPLRKGTCEP